MSIPTCVLTNKGAALQARTPTGAQIPVTRWQMGTGSLPAGEKLEDMTQLVQPLTYLPISSVTNSGRQCLVLGQFVNEGMDAFDWEELGLWAQDPEEGEILYAVGNARGEGEHIEAWTDKVREFIFGMELVFSGTANVTAEISRTLVFSTLKDLDSAISAHNTDPEAHPSLHEAIKTAKAAADDALQSLEDFKWKVEEDGVGGIHPRIVVTARPGSTVTIADGERIFAPVEHNGIWEQNVPYFGMWTVTAKRNEESTETEIVEVDAVKVYKIDLTFVAAINVIAPEGASITCTGNGKTQSIISTGMDAITIHSAGTYTLTRNKGGRIAEREISVTENGKTVDLVLSYRYGYRKKKSEGSPPDRVEYLFDAVDMTPAHMDYSAERFEIGDWGDAWFVKKNRPVMQKSDLTEDYELDHNDHTKRLDNGEKSDVDNTGYDGNAMSAIPLCWWLRYEEDGYEYYIVCEHQWDSSYKAFAHTRADGTIEDYFYWGMFGGSGSKTKIRSLKGQSLAQSLTTQDQIDGATANGPGWYIHSWSRRECIKDLLILMAKTTDTQTAYGKGNCRSASGVAGFLTTGTLSDKGQFWGSTANNQQVKVFYIEGFWGDQWLRTAGIISNKGPIFYKMTPEGQGYRINDVEGYTDSGVTITGSISQRYISATKCGEFGCIPTAFSGAENLYECDAVWSNQTQLNYLVTGAGASTATGFGGAFSFSVDDAPSAAPWHYGCGLSSDMPGAAQAAR